MQTPELTQQFPSNIQPYRNSYIPEAQKRSGGLPTTSESGSLVIATYPNKEASPTVGDLLEELRKKSQAEQK